MSKCLYCYNPLNPDEAEYHPLCSKAFFGSEIQPVIDLELKQIVELAVKNLNNRISVPGVQPKLSLDFKKGKTQKNRLTLVGLWGKFILKPPFESYPEITELEDLTMHMAQALKISTANHSLIRLKSGELAYITKRFDRSGEIKLALEDMAQLTETLTENKYRGSMEKIGKLILKYSTYPGIDAIRLFEVTLFSYITGNSDMHLKNFSLLTNEDNEIMLSPAYDLLAAKLLLPEDKEELALTLNGKKCKLDKKDFDSFADKMNIEQKAVNKIYSRFNNSIPVLKEWINKSFLSEQMKEACINLINLRINILKE